jgi:putative DNA methylase
MAYADAVAVYLTFAVDKMTTTNCALCTWQTEPTRLVAAFSRQALAMVWDYAEANPFSDAAGDYRLGIGSLTEVLDRLSPGKRGIVRQLDATVAEQPISRPVLSTDPPYYDNIGYADLSDFFYVWMRRSLRTLFPSIFSTLLVPKDQELIATPFRFGGDRSKADQFFEDGLGVAFKLMRRACRSEYPLTVFYAFKQAELDGGESEDEDNRTTMVASTGWETMLAGLIRAGFCITGTWPMRTELTVALKVRVSALASSVVLVCRPRPDDAPLTTRRDFLNALRRELPAALRDLQRGNIAPVDLAQASIGPGMAIYSRHSRVLEADGSAMTVRTALALINQALDAYLEEQEGEYDADTRWALAWFEQFGFEEGPFGDAETLSKAKNTSVGGMVEAGILSARAGKARLLRREELPADWNPASDRRLTVWEVAQHLIRTMQERGEPAAAELLAKVGGLGEAARDLAYRLYTICERKGWAQEALP